MSTPYLERVILGEDRGAASWIIRIALWPFSLIYGLGLAVYLAIYSIGLRKRCRLPVPVISIGNLTFGGTGKTPAVQAICRMLCSQGRKVVILSRGHGGTGSESKIVSDGVTVLCDSDQAGDEPVLLARTRPGVPVVVGKDRRESGNLACRQFKPDVILLDDGMQYWQLHRDLDIALVDAARPFGSGFVMPMGDLREPKSGLKRAGVALVTNASQLESEHWERLKKAITKRAPDALILRCEKKPSKLLKAGSGEDIGPGWLRGRKIMAFCGIGRPESFYKTLELSGANIVSSVVFSDHHKYTQDDISALASEYASSGAEAVITTEKDFARLGANSCIDDLYVLGIELEIEEDRQLAQYITKRIDNTSKTAPA